MRPEKRRIDPRLYQIATLTALLIYGVTALDFEVDGLTVLVTLGSALAAQRFFSLAAGIRFDARSALISGLSLCLLMRTNFFPLLVVAAFVTIGSKFLLRWNGKHVFNPTNFGLVAMMLLTGQVWVSPGQWGSTAFFGFLLACLGGLVVNRATRSDVTYAFLVSYVGILFARALWLGLPFTIPLHQLQNGAFLIFTFFMISDPKTTPDSRAGRILFAFLVALGAAFIQFGLFRTNGLLWSLAFFALTVPLIDRLLPGTRYQWSRKPAFAPATDASMNPPGEPRPVRKRKELSMIRTWSGIALLAGALLIPAGAHAFCGFYVAGGDAQLFNQASQVVLVRDGDRTVITMANDFKGEPKAFAIVVPVPTVLEQGQIHVGDKAVIDHLDQFTAPRLVEYFDENPCQLSVTQEMAAKSSGMRSADAAAPRSRALGVTIEAQYTVGEYDIVILSATQSNGLATWLRENGYTIPGGASRVLTSYIRNGMKFFVAKVNLKQQSKLGFTYLRPIQIAYESPRFMLPIRLGMVNANGPQDLLVYALTRQGRVETTNYRTVKLPSDIEIPSFVKDDFATFYRALFDHQVERHGMATVFTEYAWDMGWCDPCASNPLSRDELKSLGVFWLDDDAQGRGKGGAQNAFVTRLHVRYDAAHFPEDLMLQVTADRTNFQGRYVMRHFWQGTESCDGAAAYRARLPERRAEQGRALAELTGWKLTEIRARMAVAADWSAASDNLKWWQRIWN